jgi:RHS repeat-associated protein
VAQSLIKFDDAFLLAPLSLTGFSNPITTRGYTGHEMVDDMGIIHMNGRIYDSRLGRFLQADPFIQAATNTQSYNRYSYVLNNPLNATDPSGFFFKKLWNKIRPFVGIIVAAVLTYWGCEPCGQYAYLWIGGASGAAGAAANGGNVLRGAVTGMITAAVFNGIGSKYNIKMAKDGSNFWSAGVSGGARHILTHAVAGGVLSSLQGGKFGHGFVSAGLTKGFMSHSGFDYSDGSSSAVIGRTIVAAIVGGTISEMTGGKFANGATAAAMAHLFNQELSAAQQRAYAEQVRDRLLESVRQLRKDINGWDEKTYSTYFDGYTKKSTLGFVNAEIHKLEAALMTDAAVANIYNFISDASTAVATHAATGGASALPKAASWALKLFDYPDSNYKFDVSGWHATCQTVISCGFNSPSMTYYPLKKIGPPILVGF